MSLPQLNLQVSKLFFCLLCILYGIAILSVMLSALPIILKIITVLLCLLIMIWSMQRYVLLQSPHSIIFAKIEKGVTWQLMDKSGKLQSACLQNNTICTRWLVILNFKLASHFWGLPIIIFPDSITSDRFRQLRAYLYTVRGKTA